VARLNLGPLLAEAAFEEMLPSDFVLGVDESAKYWFTIVGVHLEVLVGERASDTLDKDEGEIELGMIGGKGIAEGA
jgi:hypothetical protein